MQSTTPGVRRDVWSSLRFRLAPGMFGLRSSLSCGQFGPVDGSVEGCFGILRDFDELMVVADRM
ncbi:MAG: hypothetical protein CMJ81_24560 [Planctomycetaceae bacterium]|nr:hypothetical protein [Planctomycetaceae bacterium]MBP60729.1 hypothetical protein [Planctomycetaceae bacterium]